MEIRHYADSKGFIPFDSWFDALPDRQTQAIVEVRLDRVAAGNFGDCKPVRDGVQELRIDHGPGYRVYLSRQGPVLVLLLCGSDKRNQSREIEKAIEHLNNWKQRGRP
jgi:putative addiction module killer protein